MILYILNMIFTVICDTSLLKDKYNMVMSNIVIVTEYIIFIGEENYLVHNCV